LFVARTTTTFAKAESAVLTDLETANATAANTEKESILYYHSVVAVDPSFGRWGLATSGPAVFVPVLPAKGVVGAETIAALAVASSYK
jgi:hypothetical protein